MLLLASNSNNEFWSTSLTHRLSALKSKTAEEISLLLHRMTAQTLPDSAAVAFPCWVPHTPPPHSPDRVWALWGREGLLTHLYTD